MDGLKIPPQERPARRRRKEARPGEIIDAGMLEFAEHGFAATRLEDVAQRAGIAKGTIYRYFASKEALFEAAIRSRITPMFDQIEGLADAYPGSMTDLLKMVFPKIYRELIQSDLHVLIRIIITEGSRFPAICELYHRESIAKGRSILTKIVERGVKRGEFRRGPATDLPIIIVAPAIMAAVWKMTFEPFDPIPVERFFAAHVDLVLNGICMNP